MPIVYKITNQITNKVYIGWSNKTVDARWAEHISDALKNQDNRKFYNAIRKYGTDVWIREVICEVNSREEAKSKEIEFIAENNSYYNGYNATRGGDGNNGIVMSEESNLARSLALKGKPKNYIRMAGKKHSEESKEKISQAHKGMKKPWVNWSNDQIIKRAMTRRGLSLEQYNKIHELKKSGMTIKDISVSTEISYDLVKKWLKQKWELNRLCDVEENNKCY